MFSISMILKQKFSLRLLKISHLLKDYRDGNHVSFMKLATIVLRISILTMICLFNRAYFQVGLESLYMVVSYPGIFSIDSMQYVHICVAFSLLSVCSCYGQHLT